MRSLLLGLALFAGAAAAENVTVGEDRIPARLLKPEGNGPFPAVVIMHDCSGLGPRSSGAPGRWAELLLDRGYVVFLPDSFGTRGYPNGVCTEASKGRLDVRPGRRARDARAALAYLRSLSFVNKEKVGLMGGSHGGTTTLATLANPGSGFVAAVALYPRCGQFAQLKPEVPLLILTGELDDWTPAAECKPLAGERVAVKIYPGAHHSFDSSRPERFIAERVNPSAPSGRGATTAGNAEAWRDSIGQVADFFEKTLKR
ncbi:MAG TPA: dienelactone hydrolase family protein [Burkholderiales bacterium]|nr:dienelactone hydrolase family protein [Burkholderiales bacterium]